MAAPEINESLRSVANWLNWLNAPSLHSRIHRGQLFTGGTVVSVNGTLAFQFTAGPSLENHFTHNFYCSGLGSLHLYENPTIGTVGNIITPWNHNRGSSGTATTIMYAEPAVADVGTWRTTKIIGGTGVAGASTAGQAERSQEIEFEASQSWLAVVETGGALVVSYEATWYEEA